MIWEFLLTLKTLNNLLIHMSVNKLSKNLIDDDMYCEIGL